jgi:hypothetical protein
MKRCVFCRNALAAHEHSLVIRVAAAFMPRSGVPMTLFRFLHHFNCFVRAEDALPVSAGRLNRARLNPAPGASCSRNRQASAGAPGEDPRPATAMPATVAPNRPISPVGAKSSANEFSAYRPITHRIGRPPAFCKKTVFTVRKRAWKIIPFFLSQKRPGRHYRMTIPIYPAGTLHELDRQRIRRTLS